MTKSHAISDDVEASISRWEEAAWRRIEARMAEDAERGRNEVRRPVESPMRILIADDSGPVRRQLRRLIQSQLPGTIVEEAEDGREAVNKVIQRSPDVAILDIAMPVLNGLLATEQIAAISPDLPVIINTMYATPQIAGEVRKRGAKAVVPKDDVQGLLSAIERLSETEVSTSFQ
jgi:DNA-binding NarL/FixJ family response regulator